MVRWLEPAMEPVVLQPQRLMVLSWMVILSRWALGMTDTLRNRRPAPEVC